jgi:hypothetical protein
MDRKFFFHKVYQMRAAQREYFKTRNSAALVTSKRLEKCIDEEIKRVKAIMADNAKSHYELVDTGYMKDKEWINCHIIDSLDYFFCDAQNLKQETFDTHIEEKGFACMYDFPTLVINDVGDLSDDDMLEFKFQLINGKCLVSFLDRLKG